MKDSCLIVIFNHRYDKNIIKIRELYKNKFSDIYIAMPFYDGESIDGVEIIPIYHSSFCFQVYITQVYEVIRKKQEYKHYVVIGDDLVINPSINENNICDYLGLKMGDSYVTRAWHLSESDGVLGERLYRYIIAPFRIYNGTEWENRIPHKEEAFELCYKKDSSVPDKIKLKWLLNQSLIKTSGRQRIKQTWYAIKAIFLNKGFSMPYPLYKGYSDFLVLDGDDMKSLCRIFGVTAAMGLFVEVAIPTAMMLTCKHVVLEKDIKRHGVEYWSDQDRRAFDEKYSSSLDNLFLNWDSDVIYYHPVKLSKWS